MIDSYQHIDAEFLEFPRIMILSSRSGQAFGPPFDAISHHLVGHGVGIQTSLFLAPWYYRFIWYKW